MCIKYNECHNAGGKLVLSELEFLPTGFLLMSENQVTFYTLVFCDEIRNPLLVGPRHIDSASWWDPSGV
ncbi:MAG: hypothetical protein ACP5OH_07445 [Nitrososphaerota archaeon]